jgi:hypothetical protein
MLVPVIFSVSVFTGTYEFNTSAGGYIFFSQFSDYLYARYVDKYLVTSLALFFLSANFG